MLRAESAEKVDVGDPQSGLGSSFCLILGEAKEGIGHKLTGSGRLALRRSCAAKENRMGSSGFCMFRKRLAKAEPGKVAGASSGLLTKVECLPCVQFRSHNS